jgi:hypothetical protein
MKANNLLGKKFHSLTPIKIIGEDKKHRKIWECLCDCGKIKSIRARHLVSGQIKTCGCGIGIIRPKPALGLKNEKHPRWKGGIFQSLDGYIMQYVGDGNYKLQHKLIFEKKFGLIPKDCVIHHKNEIKSDNRLENLELMKRSQHAIHHNLGNKGTHIKKIELKKEKNNG